MRAPLSIFCVLLFAACSNERARPEPTPGKDAGMTAADAGMIQDAGEGADGGAALDAAPQPFTGRVALLAGRASNGPDFAVATLDGDQVTIAAEDRSADTLIVRESAGRIFLLDHATGRVSMHEAVVGLPELTAFDLPSGADAKPANVVFVETAHKIFVSVASAAGLAIADISGATPVVRELDLSSLADDGNPDANQLLLDGDQLLVGLSRRTPGRNDQDGDPARIAVVDVNTETMTRIIELPLTSISGPFARLTNRDLLVALRNNSFEDDGSGLMQVALDGAVYRLSRRGAGDYTVGAPILDEMTLDGNLIQLLMIDDASGFIVRDPFLGSRQLFPLALGPTGATVGTQLFMSTDNLAEDLCASADGSLLVTGAAKYAQFGADGVAFVDVSSGTTLNTTLPDPGFTPRSCVIVSAH